MALPSHPRPPRGLPQEPLRDDAIQPITPAEFQAFQRLVKEKLGIHLSDAKQALVSGRLQSRLNLHRLRTFKQYLDLLRSPEHAPELQQALDRLTTNETSFFREAAHYPIVREYIRSLRPLPVPFRFWSAASSSGEEAYTMAMVLDEAIPSGAFEILGTDISTRVLEKARLGTYPLERAAQIPAHLLKRCCLRGTGPAEGTLRIKAHLRDKVEFLHANLTEPLPAGLGMFDLIFLRNVLIYFENDMKRRVIDHVVRHLKPAGLLVLGHSESLNGVTDRMRCLRPTIYRLP